MPSTEDMFDETQQRAMVYLQMSEQGHGLDISEDADLREVFELGAVLGAMATVEVLSEHGVIEQHTGPDYDYLYEESDDDTIEE